jgi:hypothetical protein
MTRQGLANGAAVLGPVDLERLAALQHFIGPDRLTQVLRGCGRRNRRHGRLTHEVMLWVVLAMGILTDLPLREVFRHATPRRPGQKLPGRSGLCQARQRLGVAPVRRLFDQVVRPLARPDRPGGFYKGLHLVGLDGTTFDVPSANVLQRLVKSRCCDKGSASLALRTGRASDG